VVCSIWGLHAILYLRAELRSLASLRLLHRYERRGWVTYSHGTDIKNVCAELSTVKVKDCQLSCSVNRDLTRRIKHGAPATWTRKAVHSDLHSAIALIK
jgi:hypothetical protein